MKLSEAIRKGCEESEYCEGCYFGKPGQSCAIGATMRVHHTNSMTDIREAYPVLNEDTPPGLKKHPYPHSDANGRETLEDWIYYENDRPARRVKDPRKRVARMLEKVGL